MRKIVTLTGAGMSADSGLSTFRNAGGLWTQHAIEDVATPEDFTRSVHGPATRIVPEWVSEVPGETGI